MAQRWWAWWELMQPAGRVDEKGAWGRPEALGGEAWEEVAKTHGRNGMLLVVGCLLWWGDAVAADGDVALREGWKDAVRDVYWVL
ncbi:hypothetical protein DFH09DRAFT_954871, partial [Mycena vulgaris]